MQFWGSRATILLFLVLRCTVDLGLECVRRSTISGGSGWDPSLHLFGCSAFALVLFLTLHWRSGTKSNSANLSGSDQLMGWMLTANGCKRALFSAFGGCVEACADQMHCRCFLALGLVRFKVLSLGAVLLKFVLAFHYKEYGTIVKLAFLGIFMLSWIAFGFFEIGIANSWWTGPDSLPVAEISARRTGLCFGVIAQVVLTVLVDWIRLQALKSGISDKSPDSASVFMWQVSLAAAHLLFFVQAKGTLQGLAQRSLELCHQPLAACLVVLQGSMWYLLPFICVGTMFANGLVRSRSAVLVPFLLWVIVPGCCKDATQEINLAGFNDSKDQVLETFLGCQVVLLALVCEYLLMSKVQESGSHPKAEKTCSLVPAQDMTCHSVSCSICLEEAAVFAAVPCGHKSLCASCAVAMEGGKRSTKKRRNNTTVTCVICREIVREFIRVYD